MVALRFLRKAVGWHGVPRKITIDKSGANTAAIESYNTENDSGIKMRHVKYLDNMIERDHWAIKRMIGPMFGFMSFWSAETSIVDIEIMHMIRKSRFCSTAKAVPSRAILLPYRVVQIIVPKDRFGHGTSLRQNPIFHHIDGKDRSSSGCSGQICWHEA